MTQLEMAKVINLNSAQAYGAKENGKTPFIADEMKAIQNEINSRLNMELTIDELFF